MDNYVILKQIGHGSYGKAFKAVPRESHDVIVIKAIDVKSLSTKQRADAVNEVNVLRQLRHPYIIQHLTNFFDQGKLCIVMDFAAGGDLGTRIKAMKLASSSFTEAQISRWFVQILLGLSFIHSKNVMHRDLKPQNIFLSGEGDRALIGDFGVCRVLQSKHELAQTITGTPYYLSPEVFQHKPYSFKSDMWALACILFELASLSVPFDAADVGGLSLKVCRGSNPIFPARYSVSLKEIFQALMHRDHRSRPSSDDLLTRPFVCQLVESLTERRSSDKESRPCSHTSKDRTSSPYTYRRVSQSPRGLPPVSASSKPITSQEKPVAFARPRSCSPRISDRDKRKASPTRSVQLLSGAHGSVCTLVRKAQALSPRDPNPGVSKRVQSPVIGQRIRSMTPQPRPVIGTFSHHAKLCTRSSAGGLSARVLKDSNPIDPLQVRSEVKSRSPARIYPPSPRRQRLSFL